MLLFWLQSKRSIRQPSGGKKPHSEGKLLLSEDELPDLSKLDKILRKPNKELLAKVLRDYPTSSTTPLDQKLLSGILDKPKQTSHLE